MQRSATGRQGQKKKKRKKNNYSKKAGRRKEAHGRRRRGKGGGTSRNKADDTGRRVDIKKGSKEEVYVTASKANVYAWCVVRLTSERRLSLRVGRQWNYITFASLGVW